MSLGEAKSYFGENVEKAPSALAPRAYTRAVPALVYFYYIAIIYYSYKKSTRISNYF